MFPPSVPRFWFAMPPVQLAALASSENSFFTTCVVANLRVGAGSADIQLAVGHFDLPQLWKVPEADHFACGQFAGCVLHHHIGAAGDGQPGAGLVGKQRHDRR